MSFAKIAFRNLPRRKLRNALTILSIIIGVGLWVGVNIASESSLYEFKDYIQAVSGEVDIIITTTSGDAFEQRKVDQAIRGIEGVQAAGRITLRGIIKSKGESYGVTLHGLDSSRDFDYNAYIVDGFRGLQQNKVTIGERLRKDLKVQLGDIITVDIPQKGRYLLQVTGVATQRVESSYNIYLDLQFAQVTFGYTGRVTSAIVHIDKSEDTSTIQSKIEKNLGEGFRVVAVKQQTIQTWEANLAGWRSGLTTVSMVTILVSVALVLNTMYMNLSERTYEVGVLRAMGARRREVFMMFMFETLTYAIVGIAAGLVVGLAMARFLYEFTSITALFGLSTGNPPFIVRPEFLLFGAVAGLLATAAGGVVPSMSAARMDVLRALKPGMRPPGKQRTALLLLTLGLPLFTVGYYTSLLGLEVYMLDIVMVVVGLVMVLAAALRVATPAIEFVLRPLGAAGKLLTKNMGRNLKRAAITYATIALCVSFIVMIGGLRIGMQESIDSTVTQYFGADIVVFPSAPLPASFSRSLQLVDPARIVAVTPMSFSGTKSHKTDIGLIIVDPDTFPKVFDRFEFSRDTPADVFFRLKSNLYSIILVSPIAEKLGVRVNEQISVTVPGGSTRLTVVGIVQGFGLTWMSFGSFSMAEAGYVSQRTATTLFLPSLTSPEAAVFYLKLRDLSSVEEVRQAIDKKYGDIYDLEYITVNELRVQVAESVGRFFVAFDLILYMAILSATAGIAATMLMNVNERRREIGILRAQGMGGKQIFVMVAGEALFLGVLGYVVGVVAGLILLKSTLMFMAQTGLPVPYLVPYDRMVFAFGLALATAIAGVLYPSIKAIRVTLVDVLRYRG